MYHDTMQETAQASAKSPAKVLFVITKSNFGGAQRYVYDLATHLPEGFEPVVAFGPAQGSSEPGMLAVLLDQAGVRTIFVPSFGRDYGLADIRAFRFVIALIKAERPDIIHLNSSKAGAIGAIAARIACVPCIIFTAHGWPFQQKKSLPWRLLAWTGSFATIVFAHRVICVSDADLHAFSWVPFVHRKLVRIHNGIDLSMSFESGARIRSAFPAGAVITGTVGELTPNKHQSALIEQARLSRDAYVAIVGEGEDRASLERLIETYRLGDRVKLFGYIPAREVMKGFDIFALPSLKEGLPYVLLEARLAGLPINANRVGGVAEILDAKDMSDFSLERMLARTVALYQQCSVKS